MGRCEISKLLVGKSERFLFSRWTDADIDLAISLWADFGTTKNLLDKGFYTEEEILENLNIQVKNFDEYGFQMYKVYKDENCDFIGCAGIFPKIINGDVKLFLEIQLKSDFFCDDYAFECLEFITNFESEKLIGNTIFLKFHTKSEFYKNTIQYFKNLEKEIVVNDYILEIKI